MKPFHKTAHALAGKTARFVQWVFAPNIDGVSGGAAVRVLDYFDRVYDGKTWLEAGASKSSDEGVKTICTQYHDRVLAAIGSKRGWPIDDEVLVAELEDGRRVLAHVQELITDGG